jgi:hypothetical protein
LLVYEKARYEGRTESLTKSLPTEEEDDEEEINYEIEGKYSLQKLVEGNEAWSETES